ncbi:MAG: polymorphic toxin type 23 domain-containing protein [Bacteroidales bacterium]|nr:polymorphic toxin type 23 domain-containing protein [Bacteroidales bacterium]MDD3666159.1 polymorphic toxin type 23 domain-containing protein [Bacteroidales bacterium]
MYYIYTDHLGSPNLITDAECNVVQELSFDAWGNRRDPATWQPYTSLASIPSPLIDRGFTFHEHLYPFTLINMNGRAYDPLVGRFLSADPYIQAPDNPQNLNRYSYCLNNPLRYTDPSGEFLAIPFMIIASTAEFLSNVIQGKSNALASAFNKSMTVTNGMSSCARVSFGSFSFGLDPFNIGLSVGYNNGGFSASAGFGLGGFYANASSSVAVGDFSFNLGAGYSSGFGNLIDRAATKVSGFNYSGGISYYDRANDQYFSFGGTIFSGSHPQNNWAVGYQKGDFSFRMTNDAFVGGDKARTAAAEIGLGNHTVGFNLFTTAPPVAERQSDYFKGGNETWESPIWGKNKKERYTYSSGSRLWAGLYLGYRNGNTNSRTGIDAPWVQDLFQNGLHKHIVHSPYFNSELGPDSRLFFQGGYINPFSLYPF